ncbi:hypothetical protein [Aestuariirhabdus litorea]|uniref:GTPase n=1 Tax=Aestuariirhabdus litorea TaxID=2528527 RepID=A0A3P3VRL4_9GAMM|nr:hypothetical protein [Aestuariirhabdus litorea]RRJ84159.1 hypothetical protein D0544_03295 [Aestuariirhabdus litorea]RWW97379.1 hypothetical protein DZC74_03290 [Endozoicomonadaceae bacterium GTF-13]
MNLNKMELYTPVQEITRSTLFEATPKAVKRELQELPLGNIPESLKRCTSMLALLNRTRVAHSDRIGIMQSFDYSYRIFESYFRPSVSIKYLRPKKQEEVSSLLQLKEEMANGYKIILKESLSNSGGGRELAVQIYMSIYYLGHCLLHSYDNFQQPSPQLWSEINHLYHLAEHRHLHQVTMGQAFEPVTANTSGDLYKQLLMLEAANPYHLNSGEHWVLYNYLGHWSKYVMLDRNRPDEGQDEYFMVDLNQAEKPFSKHSHQPPASSELRVINSKKLISLTEQHINTLAAGSSSTAIGMPASINSEHAIELLQQVCNSWKQLNYRQDLRIPVSAMAGIVWGIHSIHHLLSPASMESDLRTPQKTTGKMMNESHGGFCVRLSRADQQNLYNGQVVAMRSDRQSHPHWILGIVRWQQSTPDAHKLLGVEYIRGAVRPIKLCAQDRPGPGENYRTGLLVTQRSNGRQQHSVLTASGVYDTGREIHLDVPQQGKQYDVRASELLTRTPLIDRFSFQAA